MSQEIPILYLVVAQQHICACKAVSWFHNQCIDVFNIHVNPFHHVVHNVFGSVLKILGHTVVITSVGVCTLDVLFFVSFVNKKLGKNRRQFY